MKKKITINCDDMEATSQTNQIAEASISNGDEIERYEELLKQLAPLNQ